MKGTLTLLIALIGVVILTVCLYNQNSGWDYFHPQAVKCPPGCKPDHLDQCQKDSDCASEEICLHTPPRMGIGSICIEPCEKDGKCPDGKMCSMRGPIPHCVPYHSQDIGAARQQCLKDSDCGPNDKCCRYYDKPGKHGCCTNKHNPCYLDVMNC